MDVTMLEAIKIIAGDNKPLCEAITKCYIVCEGISAPTLEAYKILNEKYGPDLERIWNEVRLTIMNTRSLYDLLCNKRFTSTAILWTALVEMINIDLDYFESPKTSLSSEQIKNWFKFNGTDYREYLAPLVTRVDELRAEVQAERG